MYFTGFCSCSYACDMERCELSGNSIISLRKKERCRSALLDCVSLCTCALESLSRGALA